MGFRFRTTTSPVRATAHGVLPSQSQLEYDRAQLPTASDDQDRRVITCYGTSRNPEMGSGNRIKEPLSSCDVRASQDQIELYIYISRELVFARNICCAGKGLWSRRKFCISSTPAPELSSIID